MGITWAAGDAGLFWIFFMPMFGLLFYRLYHTHMTCRLLTDLRLPPHFVLNFDAVYLRWKFWIFVGGYVFLIWALMRPQWSEKKEIVSQQGRDLFIALDISKSMLAKDMGLSRLDIAKDKIKTLLHHLSCERVGLLLFSGSTFVQCPLTKDYSAFYMFLDHIDVETISSGSTALDQAITTSIQAFEDAGPRKNKLLLVVTDGEDFSSTMTQATKQAREFGMRICTLGVGSQQGAPIPLFNTEGTQIGHQKAQDGSVVISKLNDELLRSVSRQTGGTYLQVTKDTHDIKSLVSFVQKFEAEAIEDKTFSRLQEQYPFFVAISFIFLAIEWLI